MNEAELYQQMMAEYRERYQRNDPLGLVEAVRLAIMWSQPVPDWAQDIALALVERGFHANGGAVGPGKGGGLKTQYRRDRVHRKRHQLVERELARGLSENAAFARVSEQLNPKSQAWGQPRQIKASYKKVCALLANL